MESNGRFTPALRKLAHYSNDHCATCGAALPKGVPAFAGYDKEAKEIYVGDCCKSALVELASHMYWWWDSYKRPSTDEVLWRFMDFPKFVAMLKDGALYFARSDLLGDRFEGARGIASREAEWREFSLEYFRHGYRNPPDGHAPPPEEEIEKEAQRLYQDTQRVFMSDIRSTYVNCWHHNDVESEALWKLYCPGEAAGVCVRTTFAALDAAIPTGQGVKFGHVQYLNFKKQFAGTYDRIFWKKKSLSHEAEVRGIIEKRIRNGVVGPPGIKVPVDLEACIQAVIPAPGAPSWFGEVLAETVRRFQMDLPIVQSELAEEPFF